jgi:hypothetical protein
MIEMAELSPEQRILIEDYLKSLGKEKDERVNRLIARWSGILGVSAFALISAVGAILWSQINRTVEDVTKAEVTRVISDDKFVQKFGSDSKFQSDVAALVGVPIDLVAAFNSAAKDGMCPKGWAPFDAAVGRFVVGAGNTTNKDMNGTHLSNRPSFKEDAENATGGEEKHVLTVAEMPAHDHANGVYNQLMKLKGGWTAKFGDDGNEVTLDTSLPMAMTGGNQAHNNVPPFIALYYCIKQ